MNEVTLAIQAAVLERGKPTLIYTNVFIKCSTYNVVNTIDMYNLGKRLNLHFAKMGWILFDIVGIKNYSNGEEIYREESVDFSVLDELKIPSR